VLALFVGAAVWTAREIRTEHNPLTIFASDDPEIDYLMEFWEVFGQDVNFQMILVEPTVGDIYAPEILALLRDLTERIRSVRHVISAESVATVPVLSAGGDSLIGAPLVGPGPVTAGTAEQARQSVQSSALLRKFFMGGEGRTTAILVRFDGDQLGAENMRPSLVEIDEILAAAGPLARIEQVGIPGTERAYIERVQGDQLRFMPVVLSVLILVMLFLFRSIDGALLPLVGVGVSVATTVAVMVLSGTAFDIISFTIPTLILVIGVADSIHMLERWLEERRHGASPDEAVDRATATIGAACFLTSATTAVGFGSLMTAQVDIIVRFGFWAAIGVAIAWSVTVTLVPLWLSFRPLPVRGHEGDAAHRDFVDRLLSGLAALPLRFPRLVITGWLLVAAVAASLAMHVERNSSLMEELFPDDPVSIAQHFAEDRGFAILPVEVDLTGDPDAFRDPAMLARIAEIEAWLETQPIVARTGSYLDLVRELHRVLHGAPALFTDATELAQALFLYEAGGSEEIWRWITPDYGRMHVQVMRYDHGLNAYFAFEDDLAARLAAAFPPESGVQAHITGSSLIANRAVANIIRDLIASVTMAFGIIAVLMALLFRSVRVGLVSMVPNMLPLLIALATMALLGWRIRIASGIIFSVALGIAVDDTIHFLARYRQERSAGRTAEEAVLTSVRTAGRGILWTTLLLMAGFAVLMMSSFRGIYEFGALVGVVLVVAFLADLTLLPAMLLRARPFAAFVKRDR
jgi:predicted RND superfamily exporter protein